MSISMNGFDGPSTALVLNVAKTQVEPCRLIGIRAATFVLGLAALAWLNCELEAAYFGEWIVSCFASSLLSFCMTVVHPLRFVNTAMRRMRLNAQTAGSFIILCLLAAIALSGVGATEPSSKAGVAVLRAVEYANSGLMALPLPDATASRIRFAINENSALSLNTTTVGIMNRKDVLAMAYDVGLNATANVKIGDSGAYVHVVNSLKRAIPGTVRPNTLRVSTANKTVVPQWKCDCELLLQMEDGSVRKRILQEALVMPDCAHELISLGRLARDGVGTVLAPGALPSYLLFPDGKRAPIVNLGVLVIPEVSKRAADASAAFGVSGQVVQGGGRFKQVSPRILHCRANHRFHEQVNAWHKCSNAPESWKAKDCACDDCLMSTADKVHSDVQAPTVAAAGDLVSWDVFSLGVKHVHGGQSKVLGIHDHFSGFNWVRLLRNDHECQAPCSVHHGHA